MIGKEKRLAVTLIEVVIVTSIIGVLTGLLLPAVQAVRARSLQTSCLNNLRQIGTALHNYHDRIGSFPPRGRVRDLNLVPRNSQSVDDRVSWMGLILSEIEEVALDQSVVQFFQNGNDFDNPPNIGDVTPIKMYVCPADGRTVVEHPRGWSQAITSYLGVGGGSDWNGVLGLPGRQGVALTQITDGASHTVIAGERPAPDSGIAGNWLRNHVNSLGGPNCGWPVIGLQDPSDPCRGPYVFGPGSVANPCDRFHFWSFHGGGANWLFADGSVRFLRYASRDILPTLATRAGGEVVVLE